MKENFVLFQTNQTREGLIVTVSSTSAERKQDISYNGSDSKSHLPSSHLTFGQIWAPKMKENFAFFQNNWTREGLIVKVWSTWTSDSKENSGYQQNQLWLKISPTELASHFWSDLSTKNERKFCVLWLSQVFVVNSYLFSRVAEAFDRIGRQKNICSELFGKDTYKNNITEYSNK